MKANRLVGRGGIESFRERDKIMTAEIGHHARQRVVVMTLNQRQRIRGV